MRTETSPTVSRYMTFCQETPRLTREQEVDLARRWRASDDRRAADLLVRGNLRYVVAIALKHRRYGLPVSELVAEGNLGLVHALGKFDPDRGFRFVTYASYWVRAYILNYVIRSWSLVGVGSGALRSKTFFKLRRERARVTSLFGEGDHADDLLAQTLDMTQARVQTAVSRIEARDLSLDLRVSPDSKRSLVDTLVSDRRDPERSLASAQVDQRTNHVVRCALKDLDQRERYIVQHRLMDDHEDQHSLAEIGRHLGVSRERARQLELRAKRRLRARIAEIAVEHGADWLAAERSPTELPGTAAGDLTR